MLIRTNECDICGGKFRFRLFLTCDLCSKKVCSGHPDEQYSHYSQPTHSFNYPNGKSINRNEFRCYQCRTGKDPKYTHLPTPNYPSKSVIAFTVILLIIIFAISWYVYSYYNKEIYFEIDGFSDNVESDTFTIDSRSRIKLLSYAPRDTESRLHINIYSSVTGSLIGRAETVVTETHRTRTYSLTGYTTLGPGEYYLVVENPNGEYYKIIVIER